MGPQPVDKRRIGRPLRRPYAYERRAPQGLYRPEGARDLVARDLTDNPFDVSTVVDAVLDLPASIRLHYGDSLPHPRVAFRLEGPADSPEIGDLEPAFSAG